MFRSIQDGASALGKASWSPIPQRCLEKCSNVRLMYDDLSSSFHSELSLRHLCVHGHGCCKTFLFNRHHLYPFHFVTDVVTDLLCLHSHYHWDTECPLTLFKKLMLHFSLLIACMALSWLTSNTPNMASCDTINLSIVNM